MAIAGFLLAGLSFLLIIWVVLQLSKIRQQISSLQQQTIDHGYTVEQGWKNTSSKFRRLTRMLSGNGNAVPNYTVTYENIGKKLYVHTSDINLLTLAKEDNISISSGCYGEGTCGQCAFIPTKGKENLNPKSEKEKETLAIYGHPKEARLSCQCKVKGDIAAKLLNPLMSLSSWAGHV